MPALNTSGDRANAVFDMPAFASLDWLHAFNDRFSLAARARSGPTGRVSPRFLTSHGETLVSLPQGYKDAWVYSMAATTN
ncbi:hypothetical protein [Rhodanobacter lindaniclasticus]